MGRRGVIVSFVGCMTLAGTPALAQPECNPQLDLHMTDTSLQKTLDMLSVEYGFELTFPQDMDRAVSMNARLPLNLLVRKLTKGTNTLLAYRNVEGCEQPELAKVVVYPEGGTSAVILHHRPVEPPSVPDPLPGSEPQAPVEYIYIDNMEQYVREVILRKRKHDLERMTPEQKAEYRYYKKKLKDGMEPQFKDGTIKKEKRRKAGEAGDGAVAATAN